MLYAQVVVAKRTNAQELTYAVPAPIVPYIRLGSLVKVPLRGGVVMGVVTGLKKTVPSSIRAKLRDISDIERNSQVSEANLTLLVALSDYFGASVAEVAYHLLPKLAVDAERPSNLPQSPPLPVFVQADFEQRCQYYLELLQKQESSALVIFATRIQATYFQGLLGALTTQGRRRVKVGNLADIFTPLKVNSLIIVDEPYHVGSKSPRRPFMTSRSVARYRAQIEGLALVYGSELVGLGDLLEIRAKRLQLHSLLPQPKPYLIFAHDPRAFLHSTTLERLEADVSAGRTVAVMTASKGWASALYCPSCQQTVACLQCGRTMAVLTPEQLRCNYCGITQTRSQSCPSCGRADLVEVGRNAARLRSYLQNHFKDKSVIELSGDQPDLPRADIVVATEKLFSLPATHFNSVYVVGFDRFLTGVDVDAPAQALGFMIELQARADSLVIETVFPDHLVWGTVTASKLKEFFATELRLRRRYKLPPYGGQLDIVGSAATSSVRKQAEVVIAESEALLGKALIGVVRTEKAHGKRLELRLRLQLTSPPSPALKRRLRELLTPAWHLDVDV